jgi:hypothetical protein
MECALSTTALDLRMALVTGSSTGVIDRDLDTVADIEALSGVNVHAERIAITGETSTENDANDRADIDANDVAFAAAPGVTAQGAILYDEGGGTDATRHLIGGLTTGFPQPVDGGLNVAVAATELLRLLTAQA